MNNNGELGPYVGHYLFAPGYEPIGKPRHPDVWRRKARTCARCGCLANPPMQWLEAVPALCWSGIHATHDVDGRRVQRLEAEDGGLFVGQPISPSCLECAAEGRCIFGDGWDFHVEWDAGDEGDGQFAKRGGCFLASVPSAAHAVAAVLELDESRNAGAYAVYTREGERQEPLELLHSWQIDGFQTALSHKGGLLDYLYRLACIEPQLVEALRRKDTK